MANSLGGHICPPPGLIKDSQTSAWWGLTITKHQQFLINNIEVRPDLKRFIIYTNLNLLIDIELFIQKISPVIDKVAGMKILSETFAL